ncbi:MAG: hypothetical protein VKK42_31750 [Lyngbya sp.]|nr:hypothetical protein [Lyngbya sp.]
MHGKPLLETTFSPENKVESESRPTRENQETQNVPTIKPEN